MAWPECPSPGLAHRPDASPPTHPPHTRSSSALEPSLVHPRTPCSSALSSAFGAQVGHCPRALGSGFSSVLNKSLPSAPRSSIVPFEQPVSLPATPGLQPWRQAPPSGHLQAAAQQDCVCVSCEAWTHGSGRTSATGVVVVPQQCPQDSLSSPSGLLPGGARCVLGWTRASSTLAHVLSRASARGSDLTPQCPSDPYGHLAPFAGGGSTIALDGAGVPRRAGAGARLGSLLGVPLGTVAVGGSSPGITGWGPATVNTGESTPAPKPSG